MTRDEIYMARCLQIARLGSGQVSPNPMVGAVLVHGERIIGEGYHKKYGEAHAEVNCLSSVKFNDQEYIGDSTLYVSLEPCSHFGKTPPCADLIIKSGIPRVVIGCRDPFPGVNGKGIAKLKTAGIKVDLIKEELEIQCKEINKRFFCFHERHRPYIILKWAQTSDGFISNQIPPHKKNISALGAQRLLISNDYSNRLVHKWRSEEAAILVGTNTAWMDDPELTNRMWPGTSPIRLVLDMGLKLPPSLKLFKGETPTIVFNSSRHTIEPTFDLSSFKKGGVWYYQLGKEKSMVAMMIDAMYQLKITSVFVEGGRLLHQSFLDGSFWDECRVITATRLKSKQGQHAPAMEHAVKTKEYEMASDKLEVYLHDAE